MTWPVRPRRSRGVDRLARKRRARGLRALVGTGIAAILAMHGIGAFLPSTHRETVRVRVPSSAETAWQVLVDLDAMPGWRRDLDAIERLPAIDGQVRWVEQRGGNRTALVRVETAPRTRLVIQRDQSDDRYRRIYEIAPLAGSAVVVTVTEEREVGWVGLRPVVHLFSVGRGPAERHAADLVRRLSLRRHQMASAGQP